MHISYHRCTLFQKKNQSLFSECVVKMQQMHLYHNFILSRMASTYQVISPKKMSMGSTNKHNKSNLVLQGYMCYCDPEVLLAWLHSAMRYSLLTLNSQKMNSIPLNFISGCTQKDFKLRK